MRINQSVLTAAAGSLVLHLVALYALGVGMHLPRDRPEELSSEPIRIRLTPPPEPEPAISRQLVETVTPSKTPVVNSELIAETNAKASDIETQASDTPGPTRIEESDFDKIAVPMASETPAAPTPPPTPPTPESVAVAPQPESESTAAAEEPIETKPAPEPTPEPELLERMAKLEPDRRVLPAPNPETAASAAAPPRPATQPRPETPPALPEGRTQGRRRGGVEATGFVGFEAMQDEIAPYLKEIQKAVELRWREMLLTRYSGVSPTIAEIDCEISSDGKIVAVTAVGNPKDPVYAALCRHAIMKAGPFKPFPFTVPREYANRNLEIRWTFNFLMRP